MRRLTGDLWAELGAELGEGPFWDVRTGRLGFVDLTAGRLYSAGTDARIELVAQIDVPLGAALPSERDGEFLLVARDGFRVLGSDGTIDPLLTVLDKRPDLRFNDAKCDPSGRAVAGTLSLRDEAGQGTLYRLDDGPKTTTLLTGVGLSNGLGWSPDGRRFYFADTLADRVDRFEFDPGTGAIGACESFVAMPGPDGLCVDGDGGVWVASWDHGSIHRYTPQGHLDTLVELPIPHATSCAFYGETLVITTARTAESRAYAGDLFAVSAGASAPPATLWRPLGGGRP